MTDDKRYTSLSGNTSMAKVTNHFQRTKLIKHHRLTNTIHLTLKMTSAQVVETSVTNNSSSQNYTHPDDHTIRTTDTPGFKPFIMRTSLPAGCHGNIKSRVQWYVMHTESFLGIVSQTEVFFRYVFKSSGVSFSLALNIAPFKLYNLLLFSYRKSFNDKLIKE